MLQTADVRMVQPDIVKMAASPGSCSAPRYAMRTASSSSRLQTQPTIGHAANMHLTLHLAKRVEVADNPRRLNALFKNALEPQNGAFPVPSGRGLGLDLEKLEPRIKPLLCRPSRYHLRPHPHGMARCSDVHRTSVTVGPPTMGIADETIRNEAMELEQRHGRTDRNACALRR